MAESKKVVLVTEKPFAADAVGAIASVFEEAKGGKFTYAFEKLENYTDVAAVKTAIKGAAAIIVRSDKMTPEIMGEAKDSLKLIVRAGAGVDTIDLKGATDLDMCVMNTPGQNSNAVAELAFGMMITNARNHYDGTSGYELRGKTLALYGFGQVSRCMQRLAVGFGMDVLAYDPFLKAEQIESTGAKAVTSVEELFVGGNFVSLHIPLTPQTKDSITKEMLLKLPKKGVLVNTARAEVVSVSGMIEAFSERGDLRYLSDVGVAPEITEKFGDKVAFSTKKKMGAQTTEANNNAGIAAARQIVAFFEEGDAKFQVNKPGQTF